MGDQPARERLNAMRILLVCAAYPPFGKGGGPATSAAIARALAAAGHEVEVITASDTPLDEQHEGYRVRSIGSPNIYADYWTRRPAWQRLLWHMLENGNPRAYVRMRAAMRAFAPDLVATASIENVNVATWLAARRLGIPVLHFPHSYFVLCWRGTMFRGGRRCTRRCTDCRIASLGKERFARHVGTVVGESRFVVDRHREHGVFVDARRLTIPTPIPLPVPLPAAPARALRAAAPVTIGYIGNISVEKDLATLARATRRLIDRVGDRARVVVAGSGAEPLVATLRALFPPGTTFLGWTDPADFYRQVDLVVVPSAWDEPYGRVSVEPLAYGIPVVAARAGGLPENVVEGVSGHVFTPGDDAGLAVILERLVTDPDALHRLSAGALARAGDYGAAAYVARLDAAVRIAVGQGEDVG
ncbi:glycosyltransferase [uncultured Sphingomonas sp.]|uniref:glycosyltransferase n=1 Tax=uncultured Sphingomonas sp. TaxID=158754 RepID=UPI0035CAB1C1